ncbi:MAG: hypothetical protein Q9212_007301 [Teloschistes hypoglaucus]
MAASVIHTAPQSYPAPPSFSQESTDSSAAGPRLSQGGMYSYDGARSIASTPTPTPPTSRSQHQISTFNTASYPQTNGVAIQQAPPKRYNDPNSGITQQQYHPDMDKPIVYTAVYSQVPVYEMEVNGIAVMRRRSDSWLNATQILKVAGIDKGKRTKVLEKEILSGEHEKVQGGYGKYQGTWISYSRGVDFCRQYGVAEILRPVLEYDMGQDGVSACGQGKLNTPTKDQAMAAQRKRNMLNGTLDGRPSTQSQTGTFFSNISKSALNAVNAINKARFEPTGSRPPTNTRIVQGRRPSEQTAGSQETVFFPNSQQSTQSVQSDRSFPTSSQLDPALRGQTRPYLEINGASDANEPPRKRFRPSSSQGQVTFDVGNDVSMMDVATTGVNGSFLMPDSQQHMHHIPISVAGQPPLPPPTSNAALEKQTLLMSLFEDPNQTDFTNHVALSRISGEDLDIPIDTTAHTALHWAATLGRIHVLRALIAKGASIFRLNGGGETALMRAAITTNNYDNRTFHELLKLLGTSVEIQDGRGQTVLHHIAASSAIKGRWHATRSYLDSILEYIVGSSNASNSQQVSFDAAGDHGMYVPPTAAKPIGLARFMSEVVNAQDIAGDTALHCAAKIGNQAMVQQLIEVGADRTLPNRRGLRPIDIPGVGGDAKSSDLPLSIQGLDDQNPSKFEEAHQDLMNSVKDLISSATKNFNAERLKKQAQIDRAHDELRKNTALLAEEMAHLNQVQKQAHERKLMETKIKNLSHVNEAYRRTIAAAGGLGLKTDIRIGEADAGLEIDASKLPQTPMGQQGYSNVPLNLDPNSEEALYLASLPPTPILKARTEAYRKNNGRLELQVKGLKEQSSELEVQLRKVVSICIHEPVERVDEIVGRLVAAVESEKAEELDESRVGELLRRVEVEGGGRG